MLGVDLETARRMQPLDRLPKDEAARIDELHKAVLRGDREPPRAVTTRFVRSDGTELPVEAGFGHVFIGERLATFAFFRDMTEKTSMEAALRASEDRFRTVAEASPDSIAIYVDGKCVYANPKAVELYELDSPDLTGFEPFSLMPTDPVRRAQILAYVERVKEGAKLPPFVNRRTFKNGETRDLEASLRATTIGGSEAVLIFTRDITERQRLQAELLKHDRLASLGVLAAGVAHELNNPLAALSLMVNRLRSAARDNVPGKDLAEDLEQVDDAVRRMSSIIGDLLFLARPADKPHAHVDLAKVLSSSVALLRAGEPGCAKMVLDIGTLPPIHGFPSKLGQAVVNVVRNALQACASRGDAGEVRLSAREVDGEIRIVIEDNGGGIEEDVLPRLSTPFFTTKEGGTGLGLWITQGIMQSHGGRLELESTLGTGTKVTLALPA
jgi:PAS domain S-box-containing protein